MTATPPADEDAGQQQELFAIRDVAEATGISPDTIRVWERRYGWPKPVRLPSGHRRYTSEQVRWLRRVSEALAHGHRPGQVLGLKKLDFDDLIKKLGPGPQPGSGIGDNLLEAVRDFREQELRQLMLQRWQELGPHEFVSSFLGPLLAHVGRAWSDGHLQIRHEHFLTQVVADVLRHVRATLDHTPDTPVMLLTTLPGERHELGMQLVAIACAAHDVHPRLLGTEMPIEEIASAARECGAFAVGISVSLATGGIDTDRMLRDLRKNLPAHVRLLVGGSGARGVRRGPVGVDYVVELDALDKWLATVAR